MSSDQRFFDFLKERIGLDVASVGPAIIERAVRQRCSQLQAATADEYWSRLQGSADEQQALIEAVIVPETWFFRYPESFSTLARLAHELLVQRRGMRALKILSLPCSTGEEPYSIAMSLLDAGLAPHQFKVDGMDVSPLSVERARRGVYGKNSFRGQDIGFREQHFTAQNDGYLISERVREQVRLRAGNLLDPGLLVGEVYDFVFCRNLLIYFDLDTQKQVFEILKRLTHADGVLFIGPAEGNLLGRMGMRSIGIPQSFAFRRQEAIEPAPAPSFVPPPPLPVRAPPGIAAVAKVRPRPFMVAAPVMPAPAAAPSNDATALLARIADLANEGRSNEAREACESYLKQHEPVAQVFYWLGLLSDVAGSVLEAQGFYRKALYLEPQHPEALAHLAALLASRGDVAGARRLQDRAARSGRAPDSERER
ncbi:chemotaxis protein CheR [Pseudomonas gingeri NCPPB 3146 = LMG 5327]|uniref:Protein-glutamate O-methyltransferase CheR n=3 Tax=Pseudomonas gingeri TaxID=117681 RepID=A0A7Y7XZZ2_9PSED|nr:protein-glutamate O-methyltransferase CheR [Pseudomonas gingeri]NWC15021.1 protein-glutamate O-methyltransferase CheR [Pseudomonas gingeri]PNQ88886.1 chemotaxis protein CheR [Pseudomonas gingeri NCPPB 3146 = LMG 5327]